MMITIVHVLTILDSKGYRYIYYSLVTPIFLMGEEKDLEGKGRWIQRNKSLLGY